MSGSYMRKLMEAVDTSNDILEVLQARLKWLENNPNDAKENIKYYANPMIARHENKVEKEYHTDIKRINSAIQKWEKVFSSAQNLNQSIPINPMNKKTHKTLDVGVGKAGNLDEILGWLKTHVPTKARIVSESLQSMEKVSPKPINWEEGVIDVDQNRVELTSGLVIVTPTANVLVIGETTEGDEIRFLSHADLGRMSFVNGTMLKGSNYLHFEEELN
jgi:hypothetical protein